MGTKQNVMTPETITREDENRSSAEIESEIRETRSRMDATLDELGNRLTPRSLINSAFDWWESPEAGGQRNAAVKKAAVAVAHQARLHPMPAILIGSGIAWLVAESMEHDEEKEGMEGRRRIRQIGLGRKRSSPGKLEKAKETATKAKEAAAGAIGTVKEKASEISEKMHHTSEQISEQAHGAVERARHMKEELRSGYQMSTERFLEAADQYPLAVGAGFLALGALVGLVIPRTRREDELMGEQSDQLVQETKEKAGELLETGKVVGERVLETVKEEAREQGLSVGDLKDKGTQIAQKAREEAMHAAEEQGLKQPDEPEHAGIGI